MASLAFIALLVAPAFGQQIGTNTPEVHPQLPSQLCTISGGCKTINTSVVLDSQYRWLHNKDAYNNCQVNGGWDPALCPDGTTCAKNCAVEGANYAGAGITVKGNAITMNLFTNNSGVISMASPRAYLLADESHYNIYKLLNQEITYDVDVSGVPCGANGALYMSEMAADGNYHNVTNPAGAKYGTGYCDAQCPVTPFVHNANGSMSANLGNAGNCCNEMDLWEANSAATQLTPHPCSYKENGPHVCAAGTCGGICDSGGCEINPYRNGVTGFYGRGKNYTVNTLKPFTVITQFISSNGRADGELVEIKRFYRQNGVVISTPSANVTGLPNYNSLSDNYCTAQKKVFGDTSNTFASAGGFKRFSQSIKAGYVLVFSIWDDAGSFMNWLDASTGTGPGGARGPCTYESGDPAVVQAQYPEAKVTWSNIKSGDIGSTGWQ